MGFSSYCFSFKKTQDQKMLINIRSRTLLTLNLQHRLEQEYKTSHTNTVTVICHLLDLNSVMVDFRCFAKKTVTRTIIEVITITN